MSATAGKNPEAGSLGAAAAARNLGPSSDRATESPWVLVAGGFHVEGGMDRANAELAHYLCTAGAPVHLVGHRIAAEFARYSNATIHVVPMVAGSFFMSEWKLGRLGRQVAANVRAASPAARLVANGGNCVLSDINWVHFVHREWRIPPPGAPMWFRLKHGLEGWSNLRKELRALRSARILIANSERTRSDLIRDVGVAAERVRTVYLGCGSEWQSITPDRRAAARAWLGEPSDRPLVAFVGAFGHDARKGFDTLWAAWRSLCARSDWDADLIVAGGGRALPRWRGEIVRAGLESRVRLLGFTDRVTDVMAAADLLVSPVRYESYGLNVQEALSCGIPAIVSCSAGVAERYPVDLSDLLLPKPDDMHDLVARLLRWRASVEACKRRIAPLAATLRAWTWRDMAAQITAVVDCTATTAPADLPERIGIVGESR